MRAENFVRLDVVTDDELDAEPLGARAHDAQHLGMHRGVDEEGARLALALLRIIAIASAAGRSSRSEAFATGRPVRSMTICWKLSRPSSRPCEISAW